MKRHGLSYLEVLIAAGIAMIGILGAVALYPVAIMNLRKGQTVDVAASVGPSALQSAKALHIDDPQWWKFSAGGTLADVENAAYPIRADFKNKQIHPAFQPIDALCFDPRFVASVTTWNAAQNDPTLFPAVPMANALDARMRRMTLASGMVGNPRPAMNTAQARLLFKCQDDLLFERPDDETAPARQLAINDGTADKRRDYFADFEFVITAVPMTLFEDRTGNPVYNPANVMFHSTGDYHVSAVVFRERAPDLAAITTFNGDQTFIEEERLCDVTFLTPGYNGGDVTASLRSGRPVSDLNLAQSSWALVSGVETVVREAPRGPWTDPNVVPPYLGPHASGNRPVFQWYRVTGFSEVYPNGMTQSRDLTLDGPDWPANASNLRITLVSGVAGVFTERMSLK